MLSALRKVGNSTGLVLPKPLLAQIGLASGATLELTVEDGRLIGTPVKAERRAGWAEAAAEIRAGTDDEAAEWLAPGNESDDDLRW